MADAAHTIYAHRQSSLLDMCRKAQKIHRELRDYAFDIQERLGINLNHIAEINERDVKQIFLQNCKRAQLLIERTTDSNSILPRIDSHLQTFLDRTSESSKVVFEWSEWRRICSNI